MKTAFKLLGALLIIGIIYLAIDGKDMQTITTEIEIAAPIETVWYIVTDVDKWHEWSPTINASSGEVAEGSTVSITMMSKEAGKDGPKYQPKIIKLDKPKLLHWRAHMMAGFIFTNDKIIELEQTASGTKLIHKETFKGLMASMMRGQMDKGVPPMLNMMNEALKEKAEQGSS